MTKQQTRIVLAVASVSIIAALMLVLYYYFITNVKEEELDMYRMKYFTWDEFSRSETAVAKGIDNTIPDDEIRNNILALVMKVLDPLREKYGKPITINSAYRSKELNRAVGGTGSSQHLNGCATDITAGSKEENKKLFNIIKEMGTFDQLIDEKDYQWVHVSYKRIGYNRKQTLHLC